MGESALKTIPHPKRKGWLLVDKNGPLLVGGRPYDQQYLAVEDTLVNRTALNIPERPSQALHLLQLPPGLELRPYQVADLDFMLSRGPCLNANHPGYGKTVEALVYARALGVANILVLCPKSVRVQWQVMAEKWLQNTTGMVITNYEQLINKQRLADFQRTHWDLIIVDEAHRIRNPKAKTTLAIKALKSLHRLALTGTPIMNRPNDLWSIFDFLDPKYFGGSYWNFVNTFCHVVENPWAREIKGLTHSVEAQELLERTLAQLVVRNPDNLVGAGVYENDVQLEMYPAQSKLYKQIKQLAIDELAKDGIMIPNALTQLVKLQQVTSNTNLPEFGLTGKCTNAKFEWIEEFLQDNPNEKIVVFSRFKQTVNALRDTLTIPSTCIHGELSAAQRESAKQDFTHGRARVLAGTIGAMGEAIDGLQHVCNTVVFIDKMWNPEENTQAMRRVYRYGQPRQVNVYTLVYPKTIDIKVGKVNIEKLDDIRRVLDGNTSI